jgi:hypothetical protein
MTTLKSNFSRCYAKRREFNAYLRVFSWEDTLRYWRRYRFEGGRWQDEWTDLLLAQVEAGRAEQPLPDDVVQLLMEVTVNG